MLKLKDIEILDTAGKYIGGHFGGVHLLKVA